MIEQIDNNSNKYRIEPDFIYNRVDLFCKNYIVLHVINEKCKYYLEVQLLEKYAILGAWMMTITENDFSDISQYIFNRYKRIEYVSFYNVISDKVFSQKRHYSISLPTTYESLEMRLSSKSRYNMKRMRKMAEREFGTVSLVELGKEKITEELVSLYFKMKQNVLNIHYNLSYSEYLVKFHVTNAYVLSYGDNIAAILFTCEQCSIVYLENLAYNMALAKYSPGMMAYDMMLKMLIEKGKRSLYLGGGDYNYKRKYSSVETVVTEGKIYRSWLIELKYRWIDFYNKRLYWKIQYLKRKLSV